MPNKRNCFIFWGDKQEDNASLYGVPAQERMDVDEEFAGVEKVDKPSSSYFLQEASPPQSSPSIFSKHAWEDWKKIGQSSGNEKVNASVAATSNSPRSQPPQSAPVDLTRTPQLTTFRPWLWQSSGESPPKSPLTRTFSESSSVSSRFSSVSSHSTCSSAPVANSLPSSSSPIYCTPSTSVSPPSSYFSSPPSSYILPQEPTSSRLHPPPATTEFSAFGRRRWFTCEICHEVFSKKRLMTEHQLIAHPNWSQLLKCSHCPYVCKSRATLSKHLTREHAPKMLQCPHCPELFSMHWSLNEHVNKRHVYYRCKHCNRAIGDVNSLDYHELSRTCLECGAVFGCVWLFSQHWREHPVKIRCPLCPATFKMPSSLEYHMEWAHFGQDKQVQFFC